MNKWGTFGLACSSLAVPFGMFLIIVGIEQFNGVKLLDFTDQQIRGFEVIGLGLALFSLGLPFCEKLINKVFNH